MTDLDPADWIAKRRELLDAATEPADRIAIPSCPGYSATRDGEVWSEESNWRGMGPRPLVPVPAAGGYLKVRVNVNGNRTNRKVHRLVAEAFFGPCPEGAQVRHLDGDKANNAATNLAYGTAKENADDREAHGTTARGHRNGYSKRFDRELVQRVVWLHLAGLSNRQIETYVSLGREAVGLVLAENAALTSDARTSLSRALDALEAALGPAKGHRAFVTKRGRDNCICTICDMCRAIESALRGDS